VEAGQAGRCYQDDPTTPRPQPGRVSSLPLLYSDLAVPPPHREPREPDAEEEGGAGFGYHADEVVAPLGVAE
jgi:hypothetical protein